MNRWLGACVLAALTISPASAGGYPMTWSWSCYSMPVYVYPATYFYAAPVIVTPGVPLAVPTAAPPSRLEMPPAGGKKNAVPTVTESRSSSGELVKDRCRVGFWNLTGKDVTLIVNGATRTLPRHRALTLDLPRAFSWHIDQQAAQTERVGEDKASYEVVIR